MSQRPCSKSSRQRAKVAVAGSQAADANPPEAQAVAPPLAEGVAPGRGQ